MNTVAIFGGTAILGLSLILAACNNATTTPPVDTGAKVTPPAINDANKTYVPADITIKVGTEITLPAESGHPLKGVTSEADNPIPESSTVPVKVPFNKVGKFTFFCQFHGSPGGGMKGTITVTN
jgi:plastocyanin